VRFLALINDDDKDVLNFNHNRYAEAETDSHSGLLLDPKHVKGLYRRGIARRHLGKLEEARADLELLLDLSPNDPSIQAELNAVIKAEQLQAKVCWIYFTPLPPSVPD
jgi:Flp pilus assembly protein TadD